MKKWQAGKFNTEFKARGIDQAKFNALWGDGNNGGGDAGAYEADLLFLANASGRQLRPGKHWVSAADWRELAHAGYVRNVHYPETIAAYEEDKKELEKAEKKAAEALSGGRGGRHRGKGGKGGDGDSAATGGDGEGGGEDKGGDGDSKAK